MPLDLLQNWTTWPATIPGSRAVQEKASPKVAVGPGVKVTPTIQFSIQGDLLKGDGDFENPAWLQNLPATFSYDTGQKHKGTKSLRLGAAANGATIGPTRITPIAVVGGEDRFRLSFWARKSADYTSTDSKVRLYNADAGANAALIASPSYYTSTDLPNPDTWYWRNSTFPVPVGCSTINFRIQRNGTAGYVWVDELMLEEWFTAARTVVELLIRAFGPSDELLDEQVLGQRQVTNNVTTTNGLVTLGGAEYTPPQFTQTVQLAIRTNMVFSEVTLQRPSLTIPTPPPPSANTYYVRHHFMVEDIHGNILARDVVPMEPVVTRRLSGPAEITMKLHPKEPSIQLPNSQGPIQFKPWGHWVHALKEGLDGKEHIRASCLVQPSDIDPETGVLSLRAEGFSNYLKGIPWLMNWNPIAVDPGEIVEQIWNHVQHGSAAGSTPFVNGDLGVTVTNLDGSTPARTGTQMLPGFSFENEEFVQDFFAIFIRAVDRNDCGDYVNKLARDIPFDYFEDTTWEGGTAPIKKFIRIAYPSGGVDQQGIIFRWGENVSALTPKQPTEVNWFSDITINGYFPGKVYSATLANADPDRYRRVMDEVDLHINSNERAAAWARRRLSRRQFPAAQFESIIIDPYHPNAPHGSYDVGDIVRIQGPVPWAGDIDVKHKVLTHTWDETKGVVQLGVMAEGAFNYDPIEYAGQ